MTKNRISDAILLSAGLGTRLKPLTDKTPKPLLPLDGILLIDHQLNYLSSYGISKVVINLHHLGDAITRHVGSGKRYGLEVLYSNEPSILGTGGGVKKAAGMIGSKSLIVLNADALIDLDLGILVSSHIKKQTDAMMVLKELDADNSFTPVEVDRSGFITGFGKGNLHYTGLQILGPKVLSVLPAAGTPACLIKDGYKKLTSERVKISSLIHRGYWNDLGTMERYEQAKSDIKSGKFKPITG